MRRTPYSNQKSDKSSFTREFVRNLQERRSKVSPFIPDPTDPEDHLVASLPYLPTDSFTSKHYAGHLSASPEPEENNDKKLFYWLFEPSHSIENAPLVIWLNGGPGCSSMDGLFLENGPFHLTNDEEKGWTIEINPHSWHNIPAYVLYIDQPVGTGLSFSKNANWCRSDEEVNEDFYIFLQSFFKLFKKEFTVENGTRKELNREFYFSGESHAGHYIPSMMDYILQQNKNIEDSKENSMGDVYLQLSGAAIGNGWVDPYHQYSAAIAALGHGIIDMSQVVKLSEKEELCQRNIELGLLDSKVCFDLLDNIVDDSNGGKTSRVSTYDARVWESVGQSREYPVGHKDIEAYLGRPKLAVEDNKIRTGSASPPMSYSDDVLEALHATESIDAGQYYMECTDPPWDALKHQDGKGVVKEVVRILDHESKPRLLFFNGIFDLICNHHGNEKFLEKLPWKNIDKWILSKRYAWGANKSHLQPYGYMKEFENLLFLKIMDAGHMVPIDQPEVMLAMMRSLIAGGNSFQDHQQYILQSGIERDTKADCSSTQESSSSSEFVSNVEIKPVNNGIKGEKNEGAIAPVSVRNMIIAGAWLSAFFGFVAFAIFGVKWHRNTRRRRAQSFRRLNEDVELTNSHTID